MANNYFINEFTLGVAYKAKKPDMYKLLRAIYPDDDPEKVWEHEYSGDEINDRIEQVLKSILGGNTPSLCLDTFVRYFGDDSIDSRKPTIRMVIEDIVKHKDVIYRNIEARCRK